MSKSYINEVVLRDGAVKLYQRQNAKRGFWYYRIQVRGMRDISGKKIKYDERSTGETDLDEATRIAFDRHDELRTRVRRNEAIRSITFAELYQLWWARKREKLTLNYLNRGRSGKVERIDWFEKQSKRYWLPYFGKHSLDDMTHAFVEGYWQWRMDYWQNASEQERAKHPNHAQRPSKKTLDMEQGSLGEIFAWGNSMKLFNFRPIIRNPYSRLGLPVTRRPSFEPSEFEALRQYLDKWSNGEGKDDSEPGARLHSVHLYQRRLLRCYVLLIAYTGMRPGEALKLRHRDISQEESSEFGIRHLVFYVPDDTKTRARKVIGDQSAAQAIHDLLYCGFRRSRAGIPI